MEEYDDIHNFHTPEVMSSTSSAGNSGECCHAEFFSAEEAESPSCSDVEDPIWEPEFKVSDVDHLKGGSVRFPIRHLNAVESVLEDTLQLITGCKTRVALTGSGVLANQQAQPDSNEQVKSNTLSDFDLEEHSMVARRCMIDSRAARSAHDDGNSVITSNGVANEPSVTDEPPDEGREGESEDKRMRKKQEFSSPESLDHLDVDVGHDGSDDMKQYGQTDMIPFRSSLEATSFDCLENATPLHAFAEARKQATDQDVLQLRILFLVALQLQMLCFDVTETDKA